MKRKIVDVGALIRRVLGVLGVAAAVGVMAACPEVNSGGGGGEDTGSDFVAVTDITGVPASAVKGTPLTFAGVIQPSNATNKTIVWSVTSGGSIATISGNALTATAAGNVTVTAAVANGLARGQAFTKSFTITVIDAADFVAVTNITGVPGTATAGTDLTLSGIVAPDNATNKVIVWSVKSAGDTGATIEGNTLKTTAAGTVTVTATIANGVKSGSGAAFGEYVKDFAITVNPNGAVPVSATGGPFSTAEEMKAWLATQSGGASADDVLGVIYTGSETPGVLYAALASAEKYVSLDLSGSATSGFASGIEPGRALIVELILPDTLPTTSIFNGYTALVSVRIPAAASGNFGAKFSGSKVRGVTLTGTGAIPAKAFEYVYGITGVTVGDGVTGIGNEAFYSCTALSSVTIGNGVASIGDSAFQKCGALTGVSIGNSVASIGDYAFRGCTALASISVPDSVTVIGNLAFDGTAWYNSQPDGLVYAGKVLYAYKGTMPNNTSIPIRDGTVSITYGAFDGCTGLVSVTIPDSVAVIGYNAFRNCVGLTSVSIPGGVTSIGYRAFSGCTALSSLTISAGVDSIGNYAFSGCAALSSLTIPDSVTSVGSGAFSGCTTISSLTIPDSVTSVGGSAFSGCANLASVTLPVTVSGSFRTNFGSQVVSVALTGTGAMPADAFDNCAKLERVIIGAGVTTVTEDEFDGCVALATLLVDNGNSAYRAEDNVLFDKAKTTLVFCPESKTGSYRIPDGVTSIKNYAFQNCAGLTDLSIPASVASVGTGAFKDCTALASVSLARSTQSFGISGLSGSLVTAATVTGTGGIPDNAFSGFSKLTSVTITEGVTDIGQYAFRYCSQLASVTIPSSVSVIKSYAFGDCAGLEEVRIPNHLNPAPDGWEGTAANVRALLIENTYGNGVKYIEGVHTIQSNAFAGCVKLSRVYFDGGAIYDHDNYEAEYTDRMAAATASLILDILKGSIPGLSTILDAIRFFTTGETPSITQYEYTEFNSRGFHDNAFPNSGKSGVSNGVKDGYLNWYSTNSVNTGCVVSYNN